MDAGGEWGMQQKNPTRCQNVQGVKAKADWLSAVGGLLPRADKRTRIPARYLSAAKRNSTSVDNEGSEALHFDTSWEFRSD